MTDASAGSKPNVIFPVVSSEYPRTYRPSLARRGLIYISGVVALIFCGALVWVSWLMGTRHDASGAVFFAILGLLVLFWGTKLIMEAARAKFILLPDAIEDHGPIFTRILRLDEIEGYCRTPAGRTPAIEFWPKQNLLNSESSRLKMIRIFMTFQPDAAFENWISGLRNLDEEEGKSGVFIYSSPLSPKAMAASNKPNWFPHMAIIFPTIALMLVYSFIASFRPGALQWADPLVTSLVDGLGLIGLGIGKPMMDGPMSERIYLNIVGIGLWGAVTYNAMSIWWMANGKGLRAVDRKALWQRMSVHFGPIGAWFALPLLFLVYVLLASLFTLALLNGINGWFVFHVHDFISPAFVVMMFVFPGAFTVVLWVGLVRYIGLAILKRSSF